MRGLFSNTFFRGDDQCGRQPPVSLQTNIWPKCGIGGEPLSEKFLPYVAKPPGQVPLNGSDRNLAPNSRK